MSVTIRTMTENEFENFCRRSMEDHARELMEELHISEEKATKAAKEEIAGMMPDGRNTKSNYFMTIVAEHENAGFIWTLHEQVNGRKQCFICDFFVFESKRRKGYGAAALRLAEKHAASAGCQESVLFVADRNNGARALYKKCGYRLLQQEGYGCFLVKRLR